MHELLKKVRDMTKKALEEVAQTGELKRDMMDDIYKMVCTIKDTYKIGMLEAAEKYGQNSYGPTTMSPPTGGMSFGGGMSYGTMPYGNSYDNGMSEARRGGRGGYSRGGSYGDGYSRGNVKAEMMEEFEELMQKAPDSQTREMIRRCMDSIQNM